MKFLIAGLGSIGRRHLRNLLALGEDDILLYRTGRSTLPDDELAQFPVETDLGAALAHKPDAVIVSNPTSLHLEVAIPAAEAGCHLLVEKPISHTMAGIDELQAAVAHGGGQVLVGYQFRFHPGLQQTSRLLAENAIGRPLSVRAHWGEYLPDWHPWEDYRQGYSARIDLGGGVILTLSHPLDYLRWLFGNVEACWAFAGQLNDLGLGVEDTVEIGLRFTNGTLGSLHLDYNQRPPSHWLEVIGTNGTLRWDNKDGVVRLYQAGKPLPSKKETWTVYPPDSQSEGRPFERNDMFLAEMAHFRDLILGNSKSTCSLTDGIETMRLALGIHDSSRQARLIEF